MTEKQGSRFTVHGSRFSQFSVVICVLLIFTGVCCIQAAAVQSEKKSNKKVITTVDKEKKAEQKTEDVVPPDVKTKEDFLAEPAGEGEERPVITTYSIWRVVFSLIMVIGLILFITYLLRYLWARGLRLEFKGRHIRVLDTLSLGLNRVLYLVQVGSKVVMIASTDKGINMVTEITDPDEIAAILEEYKPAPASPVPMAPFTSQLRQAFTRSQPTESGAKTPSLMEKLKEKLSGLNEEK
ncbi:MAG: flagellar biosynthetic protein FliO [bacterium]